MKKILFLLLSVFTLAACGDEEKLYETSDEDGLSEDKVYSDATLTRRVITDLYGSMREVKSNNSGSFSRFFTMNTTCCLLDNATDDGCGNVGRIVKPLQRHIDAAISAKTNPVADTNPYVWYYRAIRNANIFISRVDGSPLSDTEKFELKNQARFLRALYYHELFRWFGALVITEQKEDPFAFETTKREDLATTVRWIVNEFDALSQPGVLPVEYENAADYGRITRGAAMAYKARTLLYAASPLSSGSGVTWQEAADAAWELIEFADATGTYELYNDGTSLSYRHMFVNRYLDGTTGTTNKEMILSYMRADANDIYNNMPSFAPWNVNKESSTNITQWLVDCYDMVDGTEPIVGYTNYTTPIINPQSGYDEQNPYANRDPRLDQTILRDGSVWPLLNNTVNTTVDISTPQAWKSGYFLVKYLDERIDHRTGGKVSMNFPMMRYAEVLLNYAEAINEAQNSLDARQKAVEQMNRIRSRAGISQNLDAADYSQATLRERIRKERRVELCFEEHRFFDIKRWEIASVVMRQPAVGISKANGVYSRFTMDSRSYNERMNLMPIPMDEVNNCPLVYQNPRY